MIADGIWDDIFEGFEDLNTKIEKMFSEIDMDGPCKVYGYTMYQGPDGIRHVREFGNKESMLIPTSIGEFREPFVDISEDNGTIRTVIEIPGVSKDDIDLSCTGRMISVNVNAPGRSLRKDIALPCEVDTNSAKAEYNNGILEVSMNAISPSTKGKHIIIS